MTLLLILVVVLAMAIAFLPMSPTAKTVAAIFLVVFALMMLFGVPARFPLMR